MFSNTWHDSLDDAFLPHCVTYTCQPPAEAAKCPSQAEPYFIWAEKHSNRVTKVQKITSNFSDIVPNFRIILSLKSISVGNGIKTPKMLSLTRYRLLFHQKCSENLKCATLSAGASRRIRWRSLRRFPDPLVGWEGNSFPIPTLRRLILGGSTQ